MSDETTGQVPQPQRTTAGSSAPRVPFLTPGDHVDAGPAGSLVQARARQRQLRSVERSSRPRGARVLLTGAGAGLILLAGARAAAGAASPALSVLLSFLGAAAWAVAAVVARRRYGPAPGERELSERIRRERRTARALEPLTAAGWTVLHDRFVPGTEHRLAHVLVGPGGVVVATEIPAHGPPSMRAGVLHVGDVPLPEWFATRWWESDHVHAALTARLQSSSWQWTGPVYPLALAPGGPDTGVLTLSAVAARLRPDRARSAAAPQAFPPAYSRVAIRTTAQARGWVASLPAPLGRLAAATLAGEVEAACVPAAVRPQPGTGD